MTISTDTRTVADETLKREILRFLERRDAALSVCPSEVARSVTDDRGWRPLMPRIRDVLAQLIREQRVIVTRGTRVLSEQELQSGTLRIRRGPQFQ